MRVAIRYEVPSPESDLITKLLSEKHEVTSLDPWDVQSHTEEYDVAVCVGPVAACPLAKRRVLLVLGATSSHRNIGWDFVVVTSNKAQLNVFRQFGHETRTCVAPIPLVDLHVGRRRVIEPFEELEIIHASEFGWDAGQEIRVMGLWGREDLPDDLATMPYDVSRDENGTLFDLLEFNTMVKQGAVGYYPGWMDDGYDVQVRRHLSLGGNVVCPRDTDVLGDMADLCSESWQHLVHPGEVDLAGSVDYYKAILGGIVEDK